MRIGTDISTPRSGGAGTSPTAIVPGFFDNFDATGPLPTTRPDGSAIVAGDRWRVSVGGTIAGLTPEEVLDPGDTIVARIDAPAAVADRYSTDGNKEQATLQEAIEGTETQRYMTPYTAVERILLTDATAIANITDEANWSGNQYSGPLTNIYKWQRYMDDATDYLYEFDGVELRRTFMGQSLSIPVSLSAGVAFEVTHNFNTPNIHFSVRDVFGENVDLEIFNILSNSFEVRAAVAGIYYITITRGPQQVVKAFSSQRSGGTNVNNLKTGASIDNYSQFGLGRTIWKNGMLYSINTAGNAILKVNEVTGATVATSSTYPTSGWAVDVLTDGQYIYAFFDGLAVQLDEDLNEVATLPMRPAIADNAPLLGASFDDSKSKILVSMYSYRQGTSIAGAAVAQVDVATFTQDQFYEVTTTAGSSYQGLWRSFEYNGERHVRYENGIGKAGSQSSHGHHYVRVLEKGTLNFVRDYTLTPLAADSQYNNYVEKVGDTIYVGNYYDDEMTIFDLVTETIISTYAKTEANAIGVFEDKLYIGTDSTGVFDELYLSTGLPTGYTFDGGSWINFISFV